MLGLLFHLWNVVVSAEDPSVPPPPPLPARVEPLMVYVGQLAQGMSFRFDANPLFAPGPRSAKETEADSANSPEVLRELQNWEAALERRSPVSSFQFERFRYDTAFGTETRGQGTVTIQGKSAQVEMRPAEILPGTVSDKRQTRGGLPFRLIMDTGEITLYDGHSLSLRNELGRHSALIYVVPPAFQTDSPLKQTLLRELRPLAPFQAFRAADRDREFQITLGRLHQLEKQVHLILHGRSRGWTDRFRSVDVLLNASSYEPIALRWIDAVGATEIVYVYSNIRSE